MKPAFSLVSALFVSLFAAGCTAPDEEESANDGAGQAVQEDACETRYVAKRESDACEAIRSDRGTWTARKGEESTCRYQWRGHDPALDPDYTALLLSAKPHETIAPECGSAMPPAPEVTIEPTTMGFEGFTCKGCGAMLEGREFSIILYDDRNGAVKIDVPLSDGTSRAYAITAPLGGCYALTITLPPPPSGTSYVAGPVGVAYTVEL